MMMSSAKRNKYDNNNNNNNNTSSVTTPWRTKYCHAEIGYPPSQPLPHKKPQHARRSLTDRDIFCNEIYCEYK